MVFARPTLATIQDRIASDLASKLPGADVRLRRSVEDVLTRVFAGACHQLHGHLLFLSKQITADTAEAEHLERWASLFGVTRLAGSRAAGNIKIQGLFSTVVPAGTVWTLADGTSYTQDAQAVILGGSQAIAGLTASEPGVAANATAGQIVTIGTPQANVVSTATIEAGGLTGGAEAETDAALLTRLQIRLQTPPRGGGIGDYVYWSRLTAIVTRAFQFSPGINGVGQVDLTFVTDGVTGGAPSGVLRIKGTPHQTSGTDVYWDRVSDSKRYKQAVPVTFSAAGYADAAIVLYSTGGGQEPENYDAICDPDEPFTYATGGTGGNIDATAGVHIVDSAGIIGHGIQPGAAAIATVLGVIDANRPVTAVARVFAPAIRIYALSVALQPQGNATLEAAVTASLESLFETLPEPSTTVYNSQISEAISQTTGEASHTFTMTVASPGGTPVAATDVVLSRQQMALLGSVVYP